MTERVLEIGVLADDLSGALASAARLHAKGLRPVVQWCRVDVPPEADAVVIDMRTRDGSAAPALEARDWGAHLRAIGCRRFELRIDSTLRGSASQELEGMLEGVGFPDPWVLAVPAFPDAGRTTIDGIQHVAGATEPLAIDVGERLFRGMSSAIIGRDCIESGEQQVVAFMRRNAGLGARRFVADATQDVHLSALAEAAGLVADEGTDLVTASPGAWLRYHPHRAAPRPRYVLVVLSSATEKNLEQLDELVSRTSATVLGPSTDSEGWTPGDDVESKPTVVVVETISSTGGANGREPDLSEAAARSAATLLNGSRRTGHRCVGLVVSGGYTAACLMKELGADGIRSTGEARPLCGTGTLVGGDWHGLRMITKGGLVGDAFTLSGLVTSLWGDLGDG